jgi:V-type H+-transporting ATPase subunit A
MYSSAHLAGLAISDLVIGTKAPLSVELGPGILNQVFDGIQRPLMTMAMTSQSIFVKNGVSCPPLDANKLW